MESLDTTILNTAVPAVLPPRVAPLSMRRAGELYAQLAVFINQWLDGDRLNPACIRICDWSITLGSFCAQYQATSTCWSLSLLQVAAGDDGAVGRLTLGRTFAKSDLLRTIALFLYRPEWRPCSDPSPEVSSSGIFIGAHYSSLIFQSGLTGLILFICICRTTAKSGPLRSTCWLILFGSGVA